MADSYLHEYSNQKDATIFFYFMAKLFGKKIFAYHHGHTINIDTRFSPNVKRNNIATYLNFHLHNNNYFKQLPYQKQIIIGYPKFYNEWSGILKRYNSTLPKKEKYILILTRPISNAYMDKSSYEHLLFTSYKKIREKLNKINIIIKKHPREDDDFIISIINKYKMENVTISDINAAVLSLSSVFTISFWTSAILDALSVGNPAIEYFKEPQGFRKYEPEGSVFKKVGIQSTDSDEELGKFIESVITNNYIPPKILRELNSYPDLSFLD